MGLENLSLQEKRHKVRNAGIVKELPLARLNPTRACYPGTWLWTLIDIICGSLGTSRNPVPPETRYLKKPMTRHQLSLRASNGGTVRQPALLTVIAVLLLNSQAWVQAQPCPTSLTATPSHALGTVDLNWAPPATGTLIDEFQLLRNGATIAVLDATATQFTDDGSGLESGRHHILDYHLVTVVPPTGTTCLPVRVRTLLSTGDVRHFDDFNNYADDNQLALEGWAIRDVNLPLEDSAWTVTNPLSRVNPPRFDGTQTTGGFVISDSDFGGATNQNPIGSGMSHDLWSPAFDCTSMSQVHLHAAVSAVLNNNGQAVFDIDVTVDGGATWTNLFRRVAPMRTTSPPVASVDNADSYFGAVHVDLTEQAAGQSSVRVRFRHFEPNWDWWIAIDDFLIDDVDGDAGGSEVLLESEDFSGGIPVEWTVQATNAGSFNTWNADDPCLRSIVNNNNGNFPYLDGRAVHRLGDAFAILDSDCNPDPSENERLVTPVVDCSGQSRVFLHFSSEYLPYFEDVPSVLVSLDGGDTWEPEPIYVLADDALFVPGEDPMFGELVFEEPRAAGESQVAFAFSYVSPGNQWWWAIDDVSITAGDPGVAGEIFRRGDCNTDGGFNIADCVFLLAGLFSGGEASSCTAACDCNDDGSINIADAVFGLANLFSGGPVPPEPGPIDCGPDPTDDPLDCTTPASCI